MSTIHYAFLCTSIVCYGMEEEPPIMQTSEIETWQHGEQFNIGLNDGTSGCAFFRQDETGNGSYFVGRVMHRAHGDPYWYFTTDAQRACREFHKIKSKVLNIRYRKPYMHRVLHEAGSDWKENLSSRETRVKEKEYILYGWAQEQLNQQQSLREKEGRLAIQAAQLLQREARAELREQRLRTLEEEIDIQRKAMQASRKSVLRSTMTEREDIKKEKEFAEDLGSE